MTITSIGVLSAGASLTAVAASPGADLAKSKGCMECHAMTTEVWGPSFRQVAKYYRGETARRTW